ncbi:group II intron maturase-specific domain-containing protein [Escherichia coli]
MDANNGKTFVNFSPAMSARAGKAIRQEVRSWGLQNRSDKSLYDLTHMFKAKIRGWIKYYGAFYKSVLYPTLRQIDRKLVLWLSRKLKLKVNAKKSAVARPETRKFLGYSFRRGWKVWCVVSPESIKRFKMWIRELTGRSTGRNLEQLIHPLKRHLTGWTVNQRPSLMRELNDWIRRRL